MNSWSIRTLSSGLPDSLLGILNIGLHSQVSFNFIQQFLLFLWFFTYIISLNQEKCFTTKENMVSNSQLYNLKVGWLDGLINTENQILFFSSKLILFKTWKSFTKRDYWLEEAKRLIKSNKKKLRRGSLNL